MMRHSGGGCWRGRAAACVGLLATAAAVHAQPLELYVDDDAPPGGDGLSWATAFRDLQDALQIPLPVGVPARVVRIAQGVYTPDRGAGDRAATFRVASGATLLGGFAGIGSPDPGARDPRAFLSVLSGDLSGDDGPGFANRADNALHVVTVEGDFNLLDGLVIRGGFVDPGATPEIAGGGVRLQVLSGWLPLTIRDCVIEDNAATIGGGVGSLGGRVRIERSTVRGNLAADSGGGAWLHGGVVRSSRFVGNLSGGRGGALFCSSRDLQIENSCLVGNSSADGGALYAWHANVRIANCTFWANVAQNGDSVSLWGWRDTSIWASILASPQAGVQLASASPRRYTLRSSIIEGGVDPSLLLSGETFAGLGNTDLSPRFADPLGIDGIAGTDDDDLRLRPNSPAIDAAWHDGDLFPELLAGGDLLGQDRVHDDPGTPNIGIGAGGALDLGAYEFHGTSCRADHDGDGAVGVADIFDYLLDWFAQRAEADFDRDRSVAVADIFGFLAAWFAGCP